MSPVAPLHKEIALVDEQKSDLQSTTQRMVPSVRRELRRLVRFRVRLCMTTAVTAPDLASTGLTAHA